MNRIEIAVLVLILAGLLLPVVCIIRICRLKKFKRTAIVTTALIRNIQRHTGYRSVYYLLTVQYGDLTGKIFTGTAIVGSKRYRIGDFIPLMYAQDDPAKYRTDFGKGLPWLFGFSLVFLGLIIWFCYWLLNLNYTIHT